MIGCKVEGKQTSPEYLEGQNGMGQVLVQHNSTQVFVQRSMCVPETLLRAVQSGLSPVPVAPPNGLNVCWHRSRGYSLGSSSAAMHAC